MTTSILGLSGNDIICGGGGNDVINAMGGSGQQLFGDAGNDLCIGPGTTHSCESPRQPDPRMSDSPTGGGPNQGNVKRAQSAPVSASCSVSNGLIKLAIKGKVSAFYNNAANILVEPVLFKYHSSTKTWVDKDLAVHTIKIGGYNGTFHNFLVRNTDNEPVKGIYYVGYYIQWYSPNGQDNAGFTWKFVTTTRRRCAAASATSGCACRTCSRIRDTHSCTAGPTPVGPAVHWFRGCIGVA